MNRIYHEGKIYRDFDCLHTIKIVPFKLQAEIIYIDNMKTYQTIFVLFALSLSAVVNAFTITDSQAGSSFLVSQRSRSNAAATAPVRTGVSSLHMGGKKSKFGIFSPAVYGAKIVLGTDKLNKIRGKGISLHSQTIGDFCQWIGAYHMRVKLIKKAKFNGDVLGFLV